MTNQQNGAQPEVISECIGGRYLTFVISKEQYAFPLTSIHEIIGIMHITHVPNTPAYKKGIINLRGKIISVISLRVKFGLEEIPYDEKTCIVITESHDSSGAYSLGVIVDSVEEVITFPQDEIETTPRYGDSLDTSAICGMGKTPTGQVVMLLDPVKSLGNSA